MNDNDKSRMQTNTTRVQSAARTDDPTLSDFALDDPEWRTFLLQYYRRSKQARPDTTLRAVYPIALKKFESLGKQCDVDLSLIANHRKHKKRPNQS